MSNFMYRFQRDVMHKKNKLKRGYTYYVIYTLYELYITDPTV